MPQGLKSLALSSLISNKVVPSPLSCAVNMPLTPELFTASTLMDPYLATATFVGVMDNFVGTTLCGIGEHAEVINSTNSSPHANDRNRRMDSLLVQVEIIRVIHEKYTCECLQVPTIQTDDVRSCIVCHHSIASTYFICYSRNSERYCP